MVTFQLLQADIAVVNDAMFIPLYIASRCVVIALFCMYLELSWHTNCLRLWTITIQLYGDWYGWVIITGSADRNLGDGNLA